MFYGAVVWDPWLIVAQIVCLQCLYYLTLGLFFAILVGTRVPWLSLVYFFDFSTLTAVTVTGWCAIASFLLTSLAGAVYMLYLIERAKKCLDFAATLYIIHLFICIMYGGWPSTITWWLVNISCLAVMSLLGEWLCIQRESREIPITRLRSIQHSAAQHSYEAVNSRVEPILNLMMLSGALDSCTDLIQCFLFGYQFIRRILFYSTSSLFGAFRVGATVGLACLAEICGPA